MAATTASAPGANLRFMNCGGTEIYPVHQKVIDAFQQVTPQVQVKADPVTRGSWQQKFTAEIAGGDAPDVVMESADTYRPFAKAGQLLQLDPYLGRDKISTANSPELAVASHRYKDKLYAWHDNGGTYASFYNPGLLDSAGLAPPDGSWSWDDYTADV